VGSGIYMELWRFLLDCWHLVLLLECCLCSD
jgi:hypothetical protein